jgi:protein tyrosine phosphatase (PTP) superfamily phosphohydrolase (DUF442 family)
MKYNITCAIFFMSVVCVLAFPVDLPNFHHLRNQIFTSGQPTNAGFSQLRSMGIETVINVLPLDECDPAEPTIVKVNNMVFFSHPFDPDNLQQETVYDFAKTLKYVEKPVLIHCSTGNHVGGLWLSYRVLIEKESIANAVLEGRQIGMQPAMEEKVLRWLAGNQ